MQHQSIFSNDLPRPAGPYSPGVRVGTLLFTAGAVGTDSDGMVPSDIREQTRNTFENLKKVLVAAGTGLEHVLKATVYLTDVSEIIGMNDVYRAYFPGDFPARTTVVVAALARPEMRVEIEMIAHIP